MPRGLFVSGLLVLALAPVVTTLEAQPPSGTLRIALVSQWVVDQHRMAWGLDRDRSLVADFGRALSQGVVDRVVFSWQRGVVERRTLLPKSIRVLGDPEAGALGGRGRFELAAVRPPAGAAAWTEVEVRSPGPSRPEDILVVEIGGELGTVGQVLEALFVGADGGAFQELPLARRAAVAAPGVPVIGAPFGRPLAVNGSMRWGGARGVEFLVARSLIDVVANGDVTTHGPADQSALQTGQGEWREGDRVFLRLSLGVLRSGAPVVVLGWKDRTYRPDGGGDEPRRGE